MLPTHAGALMPHPPAGGDAIAWYEPTNDLFGTLAHANSGSGFTYGPSAAPTALYAGLVGYTSQTVVWSIAGWTGAPGDAPFITDQASGWVQVQWNNVGGWNPDFPFTYDAAIGVLTLTASVNGVPIDVGQRLVAATSPPGLGEDYPTIAWGPE